MELLAQADLQNLTVLLDCSYFSNLAYLYATEENDAYLMYKDQHLNNFTAKRVIDRLFIFDIDFETSMARKRGARDAIPAHWCNSDFIARFREFYYAVLPELFPGDITYVDARHRPCLAKLGLESLALNGFSS